MLFSFPTFADGEMNLSLASKLDFTSELGDEVNNDYAIGQSFVLSFDVFENVSFNGMLGYDKWQGRSTNSKYGIFTSRKFKLSDYTKFNLGIGYANYFHKNRNDALIVPVAVKYYLTSKLSVFAGFDYISANGNGQDLFNYSLGLSYSLSEFDREVDITNNIAIRSSDFVSNDDFEKYKQDDNKNIYNNEVVYIHQNVICTEHYVVLYGDHLSGIAARFHMDFSSFRLMNIGYFEGRDPDLIYPGETINLSCDDK